MTSLQALDGVRYLASFALCLSGIEFFLLSRKRSFREIWSDRNLARDLSEGLPFPGMLVHRLFSASFFPVLAWIEILSALALAFFPAVGWLLLLTATHLVICIRFRGTYNGGSDMMTFVVLSGLLIGFFAGSGWGHEIGLMYIALHAGYSYLKAGLVKLVQADWRTGAAIPVFLSRSLLPHVRKTGVLLGSHSAIALSVSWLVILFEISVFGLLFFPQGRFLYAGLALGFHFGNFLMFGLNRFFWIWCAAWPALLYGLSLPSR